MAKLNADQTLKRANAHLRRGEVNEARDLCRSFLEEFPGNRRVLQALAECDQPKSAPDVGQNPPQERINALVGLLNRGQFAAAAAQSEAVLQQYPNSFMLWNILGAGSAQNKQAELAVRAFHKASELNPDSPDTQCNLGVALKDLGRLEEAVASYQRALELKPDHAEAHYNLGNALKDQGKLDEAVASYRRALTFKPAYVEACINLGHILKDLGKLEEAVASYRRALELKPDDADAYNNLGTVLQEQGKFEEADASYRSALALEPDYAKAHYNLGTVLKELAKLEEAVASYQRALAIEPDYVEAHLNRGRLDLLLGNFESGWQGYELGKNVKYATKNTNLAGRSLQRLSQVNGNEIFVHHEQGLGDTIQFCRYALMLRDLGANVVFSVQMPLVPLMRGTLDGIDVIAGDAVPEHFDYHVPLLSLPMIFETRLESIPAPIPYISADPRRVEEWSKRLGADRFKIGICWQGRRVSIDKGRSFAVSEFENVASLPGVRLISLHKGEGEKQLADLPPGMHVETLGADFDPPDAAFMDTAAVMKLCDLVITSDTSVAHLAGALGVPVWLVLKHVPDWRWLMDRDDCPWYPTMRLFRQDRPGDWRSAFAKVELALAELLQENDYDANLPPASRRAGSTKPLAPVSWGEIIDKITILEIKSERLKDATALQNVKLELAELNGIVDGNPEMGAQLVQLKSDLREVNEALWDIEDRIREKERGKDFGAEFVELARSVYITNDKRFAVKSQINKSTQSEIIEEKSYKKY